VAFKTLRRYSLLPKTIPWAKTKWLKDISLIGREPWVNSEPTLWNEAVRECEVGGGMIRGVMVAGYYCLNGQVSGSAHVAALNKALQECERARTSIVYIFWNPMPSNCIATSWDPACETRDERRVHSQRLLNDCSEIYKLSSFTECDLSICGKRATDLLNEAL
jgi:hypothetical protein